MKNYSVWVSVLLMTMSGISVAAVKVSTTIDVIAEVTTSVSVYVEGQDVTNRNISLDLKESGGYMFGVTPAFHFVGNASQVSLALIEPAGKALLSDKGDSMRLNVSWVRPNGGGVVSTSYAYRQPVYPTLTAIPDPAEGVKVQFKSAEKVDSYALGTYSGTYEVIVSPIT